MVPVMTFLHSTRFDTYHDGIWGKKKAVEEEGEAAAAFDTSKYISSSIIQQHMKRWAKVRPSFASPPTTTIRDSPCFASLRMQLHRA